MYHDPGRISCFTEFVETKLLAEGWCFNKPTTKGTYLVVNDSELDDTAYWDGREWLKDDSPNSEAMYCDETGVVVCWKPIHFPVLT